MKSQALRHIGISVILLSITLQTGYCQYSGCNFLCNTDFEDEKLVNINQFGFFHENSVSCWETSASDNLIEIWGSGFAGVKAYSGSQFAELNANMVSTLFQEFKMAYNAEVEISFAHRGRAGLDRISVEVGPLSGPFVNLGTFSADNRSWVYNTILHKFPSSGSKTYVLKFNSVSAAGGATVGNFLDAISIKLNPPKAFISKLLPTCPNSKDGIINLDSLRGAEPISFVWSVDSTNTDTFINNIGKGTYTLHIKDFYGCTDSYTIELSSISNGDSSIVQVKSCDTYYWQATDETYNLSGVYSKLFKNQYSCDSILILHLNIEKPDTFKIDHTSCTAFTWNINNSLYSKSGQYSHTLKSSRVCDSVIQLNLTILPADTTQIFESSCDNFIWELNQNQYKSSGKYFHTLNNINSCDSIIELNLRVGTTSIIEESISGCKEFVWPKNNTRYVNSGTFRYNLKTALGCDSIHILNLNILPLDSTVLQHSTCSNYIWPESGINYTNSGTYNTIRKNKNNCDSVLILQLEILKPKTTLILKEACKQYFFPASNKIYNLSGDYQFNHTATNGCDSLVTLRLKIHPEYFIEENIEICDVFYWEQSNKTYNQSGTYFNYRQSEFGCDSIIQLNLKLNKSITVVDTIKVFDSFLGHEGEVINRDTILIDHQLTNSGCDSIVVIILRILKDGEVFVPNVFSPNDDGVNDFFSVYATEEIKMINRLAIFSRWGEKMFVKNNFPPNIESLGWDGFFRDQKVSPGVFTFYVQYTNNLGLSKVLSGDLTLVR
ncbi:MAG: T9SS type B sorting domain-containing protein [Saprospiraceae bacterium]|nr:T9SS type B sorting domain-containing protein [Saprospiraceae bacterium]